MVTKKLSAFSADSFFMYVLLLVGANSVHTFFVCFLLVNIQRRATSGRPYMVCVLFLSENHKLADDIVKYQHHNVCHYLCYPIVEAEK